MSSDTTAATEAHRIKDQFTALPISAGRKYQLRQHAAGRCELCGHPLECYTHYCDQCQAKKRILKRAWMRRHFGRHRWHPGGRGSPPLSANPRQP
jgi:hypothetical protein